MSFIFTLFVVVTFWTCIHLLNAFLLECKLTSPIYAKLLSVNGLSISTLQIKWFTVRCNRLFMRISSWRPTFFKWWFNFGVLFGVVGQLGSIFLLLYTLVDFFRTKPVTQQILVPVLPGVNLPSDQTWYYFVALLICGLVHELGHAIAASREQVRVNGFGVFLMFIFPGAYVDLCSDHLNIISPLRQLRIFCAGVWHNFILVLICLLGLYLHPYMVSVLFDQKVHVSSVLKNSPLESKLEMGTVLRKIGNCPLKTSLNYYECLYNIETQPPFGYCMSADDIAKLSSSIVLKIATKPDECCMLNETMSNFCFQWFTVDLTVKKMFNAYQSTQNYACLPARVVTEKQICQENLECSDKNSVCVKPVSDNTTKLIRIELEQNIPPILYVGSIKELLYTISIEDFIPKSKIIPKFLNFKIQILLKYLVAFSGAIGLLNLVPCFALDGQHILAAILLINKSSREFVDMNETQSQRPVLYVLMMLIGTSLLILNILVSFASLTYSKVSTLFRV